MNWTPDRPTKPGKYWLSLPKHIRAELDAMVGYKTPPCFVVLLDLDRIESLHINCAIESVAFQDWTAGALWRPYVEPPDPFAEPVPSLRERIEALPDLVLGSGRVIGSAVDRGAVLALLETESQ